MVKDAIKQSNKVVSQFLGHPIHTADLAFVHRQNYAFTLVAEYSDNSEVAVYVYS